MDSNSPAYGEPSRLWLVALIPVVGSLLIFTGITVYQAKRRRPDQTYKEEHNQDNNVYDDGSLDDPLIIRSKSCLRSPPASHFRSLQAEGSIISSSTTPSQLESGHHCCTKVSPPAYHDLLRSPPKYDDLVYEDDEPLSDIQCRIARTLTQ